MNPRRTVLPISARGLGNQERRSLFLRNTAILQLNDLVFIARNYGEDRMSLSSLKSAVRYSMAVVLLAAMPASLWAQEGAQGSQGQSSQPQPSQGNLPQAPAPPAAKNFTITDYSKQN